MNMLSIDQARDGAWAVYNFDNGSLIQYGTFYFDSRKYTYSKAILHIEEIIESVIKTYDIKFVAIEDIQLRVNPQSFKKLAWLQGVLVDLCERNKLLYWLVAPTRWQKYCSARGRSTKEKTDNITSVDTGSKKETKILSIQFVKDQFGIETKNDNLADAICIGWYALNVIEFVNNEPVMLDADKNEKEKKRNGKKG